MANADRPGDNKPYGPVLRCRVYRADAAVSAGDLVKQKAGDGNATTQKRVDVEPATAGDASIGIAAYAAAAGAEVHVYDHPEQEFEMQSDGAVPADAADIGKNYNITGASGAHEIDNTSAATTATLPLKLLRIVPRVDNEIGANVRCVVKINNHQLGSHTGTAGV